MRGHAVTAGRRHAVELIGEVGTGGLVAGDEGLDACRGQLLRIV